MAADDTVTASDPLRLTPAEVEQVEAALTADPKVIPELVRLIREVGSMTTCSPEPVWESTGMTDYRWQCACGHRYGNATPERGDVGAQHEAHLSERTST